MRTSESEGTPKPLVDRIPNGLLVLLTVSLLLQGPVGAFEALRDYTTELVGALLGGEELFAEVLCQTAPLALSAGAIAFAFRGRWLTLRSGHAVVGSSLLVIAGTWVGGQLRSFIASQSEHVHPTAEVIPASDQGEFAILASHRMPSLEEPEEAAFADVISVQDAVRRLTDLRSAATQRGQDWSQPVPRVALVPEAGSLLGFVARAINQILGYIVVYRPRLFLAAILLGAYLGWTWQPIAKTIRLKITPGAAQAAADGS